MIVVAGWELSLQEAFDKLSTYPRKTPRRYDLPPCAPGPVTVDEIKRTRAIGSRISVTQGSWFCERSTSWDWDTISAAACLADADPEQAGQLYDTAAELYGHFWAQRPAGVSTAKVSKVLHLKYPGLIPILDTHLLRVYRDRARDEARRSVRLAGQSRELYWAAIRSDLQASDLSPLRARLAATAGLAVLAELTDLRLLDALAWR